MKQWMLLFIFSYTLSTVLAQTTADNQLTKAEKKDGWQLLFDGKTSKGWTWAGKTVFPDKGWVIKDGSISVEPVQGKGEFGSLDIISDKQFSAFELSFDFNVSPGGNSGVKYFVTLDYHSSPLGLEYQVLDDSLHPDAKAGRNGNRTMASLYDLIKAEKKAEFIHQPGNWNTGKVIVYPNNHVEHYLNGVKVLKYDRNSQAFKDLIAQSKYKDYPNFGLAKQGHILLQYHGNKASFKNIKIKELK
ncbi:MAG: DUF1080 domain-containing protein [Chitinophagaceae bacterium]